MQRCQRWWHLSSDIAVTSLAPERDCISGSESSAHPMRWFSDTGQSPPPELGCGAWWSTSGAKVSTLATMQQSKPVRKPFLSCSVLMLGSKCQMAPILTMMILSQLESVHQGACIPEGSRPKGGIPFLPLFRGTSTSACARCTHSSQHHSVTCMLLLLMMAPIYWTKSPLPLCSSAGRAMKSRCQEKSVLVKNYHSMSPVIS